MGIKICGIGVVSSIGIGCGENLRSLINGRCGIGPLTLFDSTVDVPVGEVKKSNTELKRILGLNPQMIISRTALLGALAAKEALEYASIPQGKRIGLISSTTVGGMDLSEQFYRDFSAGSHKGDLHFIAGHDCAAGTEFIADYCGINDFRTTVSTACSSAANAIITGARMLSGGMLDYVVAGGTDALCRFTLNGFNSLMILDKEPCKPLDRNRRGLNLGEGAGYIVLTKEDSPSDCRCLLSGYANANDAFHQTASSGTGEGAFFAMKKAMEMAKLAPADIDYINLHGTGTDNNDASELAAIKRIFGSHTPSCSSTKSFTGHTLAAAGGIEAVYSVLSITEEIRYANLRFKNKIPDGIIPVTETEKNVKIRHVLSNSFGFGGNCSSLIFSRP